MPTSITPAAQRKTFHTFTPNGWPEQFEIEYSIHPGSFRTESAPVIGAYCEIEGINLCGKSVAEWAEQRGLLKDYEAIEQEALTRHSAE